MKKVLFLVIGVVVLSLSSSVSVEAGAYKAAGIGTKALSRGGGIGAVDDYTAIFWNPAGLTQVKEGQFAIEPHYLHLKQVDGNSVKNYDIANYSSMQGDSFLRIYNTPGTAIEPAQFNKTSAVYSNISPTTSLGGCFEIKGFNFGLGMYTPVALSTDWDGSTRDLVNNALIEADFFSGIKITAYNLSVAKEINSYFSLGAGLNYLTGEMEVEAEKRYTCSAAPALDYRFDYKEEAEGDGVEGVFGILFKPLSTLKVGGVYRSGAEMTLKGDSYYKHTALGIDESSDYTQDYDFPNSYGIGLAYEPVSELTLLLEWERTGWDSVKRDMNYDLAGGAALIDTEIDWNWKDSDQVRLGAEYRVSSELSARGSIAWDESPLSDETV
ncbi:MAG: outer membrane protein transport protein, partial [Candidatus Omnitrophica bacterium]|nr:outer membrane protein transport protein [Candidatus Omnitrophota bacterium]